MVWQPGPGTFWAGAQGTDGEQPGVDGVCEWVREAGWLLHNPVGAPTEREVYAAQVTKAPVYRMLLQRL